MKDFLPNDIMYYLAYDNNSMDTYKDIMNAHNVTIMNLSGGIPVTEKHREMAIKSCGAIILHGNWDLSATQKYDARIAIESKKLLYVYDEEKGIDELDVADVAGIVDNELIYHNGNTTIYENKNRIFVEHLGQLFSLDKFEKGIDYHNDKEYDLYNDAKQYVDSIDMGRYEEIFNELPKEFHTLLSNNDYSIAIGKQDQLSICSNLTNERMYMNKYNASALCGLLSDWFNSSHIKFVSKVFYLNNKGEPENHIYNPSLVNLWLHTADDGSKAEIRKNDIEFIMTKLEIYFLWRFLRTNI